MSAAPSTPANHHPWLERYCLLALVVTTFLLFAGGYTTSTQAGMAFKTWPLSNGSLNPDGWIEDPAMRAEHSHRLLGATVGLLAIGVVVWTQFVEQRRWVRRLAIGLLLFIILQGALGGARVLFDMTVTGSADNLVARTFAVIHASGAEITTILWVTLAVAVSHGWVARGVGARAMPAAVRRWALAAVTILFLQIIIGAVMRHGGYAFAIPTFPWSGHEHEILPPTWSWPVAVNFAHRLGAGLVTIAIAGLAVNVFRSPSARRQLGSWMTVVLVIVGVQICLGAEVIWTNKNAYAATAHMLTGAFLLASTWLLALVSFRLAWWPEDAAVSNPPTPSA